ncbi:hypothetical protein EDB86DRAFT_1848832 [Lactarius hatsudake]|nr:hypothetical protein EDB86DRAFT_1848832 [Lactarius hatsudake]
MYHIVRKYRGCCPQSHRSRARYTQSQTACSSDLGPEWPRDSLLLRTHSLRALTTLLGFDTSRVPTIIFVAMGNCRSKYTADETPLVVPREVTLGEQSSPVLRLPQGVGATWPPSRKSRTKPGHYSPQVGGMFPNGRTTYDRVRCAPQGLQYMNGREYAAPSDKRSRARTSVASSGRGLSPDRREMSVGTSRQQPTVSGPACRPLNSTVRQVLPGDSKFRILVVGKVRRCHTQVFVEIDLGSIS